MCKQFIKEVFLGVLGVVEGGGAKRKASVAVSGEVLQRAASAHPAGNCQEPGPKTKHIFLSVVRHLTEV